MRDWIDVATLAHTKNLNGGLVARSASGLSLLLDEGLEVALVPPVLDAPRRVHVESASARNDAEVLVFFEEVRSMSVAEALVGCHCLVRRQDVADELGQYGEALPSWEGWRVFDEGAGFEGVVVDVEDRPVQPLLVVARVGAERSGQDDAEPSPVLVPLVDEFVLSVDEDARVIELSCPDGLLDL